MFSKVFIICSGLFVLSGCIYTDEPMPVIAGDGPGRINQPGPSTYSRVLTNVDRNTTSDWLPSSQLERNWTAIVIHHSGTENGSVAIFDKWHREGNHWEGVGYHFVIGNGTNSGDGQVEVTFRWQNQMTGAHCGGTEGNWANKYGVGICLVGNYNRTVPTPRQMQSLSRLVRFLQTRYGIPKSRVYGHNTTPGARVTDCPGRNSPMAELKWMIND